MHVILLIRNTVPKHPVCNEFYIFKKRAVCFSHMVITGLNTDPLVWRLLSSTLVPKQHKPGLRDLLHWLTTVDFKAACMQVRGENSK